MTTPDSHVSVDSDLRTTLENIFEIYSDVRRSVTFGFHEELWGSFKRVQALLTDSTPIKARPTIRVNWSVGYGAWALVPWMAFLNSRNTTTTKTGVYAVLLFREDLSGMYLALNQGVSTPRDEEGRPAGVTWLRENAISLRKYCGHLPERGFRLDSSIDLRAGSARGKAYEDSTVAYKLYERGSLPDETDFLPDLEGVLRAYDEYLSDVAESGNRTVSENDAAVAARRTWIFQANPEMYDIDSALSELDEITWLVKQYISQIKPKDLVLIWRSGRKAGIVALATVGDSPKNIEDRIEQIRFYKTDDKFSGAQLRVPLKIVRKVSPILSREAIREDPRLTSLSILRSPQGTNFQVTDEEEQALLELMDLKEAEYRASQDRKVWLIAPGKSAEHWEEFYREGIIGIGWDDLGDLSAYPSLEDIRVALSGTNDGYEGVRKNDALACYEFVHVLKPGDLVLAKKGRSTIVGYGTVVGDYTFDSKRAYFKNTRKVRWEGRGEWSYDGNLVMKTITDITKYADHVEDLRKLVGLSQDEGPETAPVAERTQYIIEDALKDLFFTKQEFEGLISLWRHKKNLILQGPAGVGKTFIARRLAYTLMGYQDPSRLGMIQFHQSYAYEDFIQGYRPSGEGFALKNGTFYSFCERARKDQDNIYVFIVDEINRGNLSKIFGELLMLIESDKRGSEWSIPLTYSSSTEVQFYVPENLFLLGMMNTADRSLAVVDYALRRRFAFVDLMPKYNEESFRIYHKRVGVAPDLTEMVITRMSELNRAILADSTNLGRGFQIGHSFFTPSPNDGPFDKAWYRRVIETEILPLLDEYWFEDLETVSEWRKRLLQG